MEVLFNLNLYSPETLLGAAWSVVIFYLLYTKSGVEVSSSGWFLLATLPAAYIAVPAVAAEVSALTQLAGGVATLDGHIGYNASHIDDFAIALGEQGRWRYAVFQLGLDTLAPPAFAGFMLNVGRSIVPYERVRRGLTVLVSVYFISVLLANALMPVYMLNFPEQSGLLSALRFLLPILDGVKYGSHAVVWLVIVCSGIITVSNRYFAGLSKKPT
ncbi:hypothetical protein HBA55_25885 [Pseudomaricurvus alkylphenolicus]|uniref:hypothetical protein n=1 Tax=Pseudomaricurvus alkylphenolicus TaxID=1306991 RepID=UPI001423AD1E|nr:hypothetical protein [Pseudomaricurvus alkylphenolicus]NIB43066.1 hypothetical protein [Pseudomaricurvus alkylphenolicus]